MRDKSEVAMAELGIGWFLFGPGAVYLLVHVYSARLGVLRVPVRFGVVVVFLVLFFGATLAVVKGLTKLKNTIVVPRAGCSTPAPRLSVSRRWIGVMLAVALLLREVLPTSSNRARSIDVCAILVIFAALYAMLWRMSRAHEILIFGGISAGFAVWGYQSGTGLNDLLLFAICLGVATAIAGAIRLFKFVKSHPLPIT